MSLKNFNHLNMTPEQAIEMAIKEGYDKYTYLQVAPSCTNGEKTQTEIFNDPSFWECFLKSQKKI